MSSELERRVQTIANSGAGRILVDWLQERQGALNKELRIANPATFQQVQGRAQEIERLINELNKGV